jgi:acetyltransferase-like isoleucine patch superfamily enzyme
MNNVNKRVKRNSFIKKIKIIFFMKVAKNMPINKFWRTRFYRLAGVCIEKGKVRIGSVSFDTIHPENIIIGKGTNIADGCIIITHYYDVFNLKEHAYYMGKIQIGRNCYIGSNCIVTKPVTIGDGVVIGAGSIINRDIPSYSVWAGVPVRFICNRYDDVNQIPYSIDDFKPY